MINKPIRHNKTKKILQIIHRSNTANEEKINHLQTNKNTLKPPQPPFDSARKLQLRFN